MGPFADVEVIGLTRADRAFQRSFRRRELPQEAVESGPRGGFRVDLFDQRCDRWADVRANCLVDETDCLLLGPCPPRAPASASTCPHLILYGP
jgi:hypothetical protein